LGSRGSRRAKSSFSTFMPSAAPPIQIGRPSPSRLQVKVVEKFKSHEARYLEEHIHQGDYRHVDTSAWKSSGTGGVSWIGCNPDPCRAKYLAKQGAIPLSKPSLTSESSGSESFARSDRASPVSGMGGVTYVGCNPDPCVAKFLIKQGASRPKQSMRVVDASEPAQRLDKQTRAYSMPVLAAARSTGAWAHENSVAIRKLEDMSCNEHYIEQRLKLRPNPLKEHSALMQTGTPLAVQKELIYNGVSHDGQGRAAYLAARRKLMPQRRLAKPVTSAAEVGWRCYAGPKKIIGRQLDPVPPAPSTIVIA